MAGVEGQGPFLPAALYQVSCRLLGCRLANMQPGSRPYAWLCFYWIMDGFHRGGGGCHLQKEILIWAVFGPQHFGCQTPSSPPLLSLTTGGFWHDAMV